MASARRVGMNENVSTFGDGTRDFSSLFTWEAATDNDLVTAQVSEVLECYADEDSFGTTVVLSGAITDANFFRIIRPAGVIGEESWEGHDGTPNNGVIINTSASITGLRIIEEFTQIQDLVVTATHDTSSSVVGFFGSADNAAFIGCIAFNITNANGTSSGFSINVGSYFLIDCLSVNCGNFGFTLSGNIVYVYNCIAIMNSRGFELINGGGVLHILKNCLGYNNSTQDFIQGGGVDITGSSNNASSDNSAFGVNNRINQIFTFVDAENDDYHLSLADGGARNHGTDLSADSVFAFDDDIDGDMWGTWDIGFDEPGALNQPIENYPYQGLQRDVGAVGAKRSWSNV